MSGIAGIYNLDGRPVDPVLLTRMTDAMAHRGPDGAGQWIDGPVGLGHRMLHTTPESLGEKQPLLDETGDLCLTFDGRVDNREQLRMAMEAKGVRLRSATDAELVLQAYKCWGEECPHKIIGDFAFVIWDRQNRQLFCARDPLGIKPLYYHTDGRRFLFASEMQPLFECPTLPRRPNLILMGLYLMSHYNEREETLYTGIYRVPPAHCLILKEGTLRKTRYWDINPEHVIHFRTDAEYAEHFLDLFKEAVRCRLRVNGPLGASLSGGLDSSSIVCTAQHLYQKNVARNNGFETFSMAFDEFPCDERAYIGEVVRRWGVKANFTIYEQHRSSFDLEQTAQYPDVLYAPVLFMNAPLFREMRQRGIKVVLDGTGGDELLAAGFSHLTDMIAQGDFRNLWQQLRHDALTYQVPRKSLFMNYCFRPFIPRPVKAALRPLVRLVRGNGIPSFINPAFLKAAGVAERLKARLLVPKFPTHSQQTIYNGLFVGWNATVAMEQLDLFTARFSMEHWYPFFDRRVVEFLLAVPETQRWRGHSSKVVLRHAMAGILPELIRSRKGKAEFSAIIDEELKHRQVDKVERLLQTSTLATLGIVDASQLLRMFKDYQTRTRQYLTGDVGFWVGLELWSRHSVSPLQSINNNLTMSHLPETARPIASRLG